MHTDPDLLYEYLDTLFQCAAGLHPIPLTSQDRLRRSGSLFAEAPYLVYKFASILAERPELFQHLPISGRDLLDRQERARAWKQVRQGLLVLLDLASDAFLYEQSEAVRTMLLLLEQIEAERALLFRHDPHAEERDIVLAAFLCEWRRRKRRIKERGRRNQRRKAKGKAP